MVRGGWLGVGERVVQNTKAQNDHDVIAKEIRSEPYPTYQKIFDLSRGDWEFGLGGVIFSRSCILHLLVTMAGLVSPLID